MNRETRKANLKKLQLPGTCTTRKTRTQQSKSPILTQFFNKTPSKQQPPNSATSAIVENLITVPSPTTRENQIVPPVLISTQPLRPTSPAHSDDAKEETKPKRAKRTKLNSFLYKDKQDVPKPTEDFDVLEKKVIRKPKTKPTTTKNTRTRSKRQQSIKSAFLRNEQIFSEITAQHCLADNFSPDDMQLALAMSKSEAEKSGIFCAEDVEEVVVDVTKENGVSAQETIRSKLKRYGFRTAAKEDYSTITAAFRPGGLVNRRHKAKWANKFTALTLRDAAQQLKKVNEKIAVLLKKQCITRPLSEEETRPLPCRLVNSALKNLLPLEQAKVFGKTEQYATVAISEFYVEDLFEVSLVKPGHLLKDWSSIQGRDLTPKKLSSQRKREQEIKEQKLLQVYGELEEFFIKRRGCEDTFVESNESQKQLQTKTELNGENVHDTRIETTYNIAKDVPNHETFVLTANVSANDENELDLMIELIEKKTLEPVNELSQATINESTVTTADELVNEINECNENPAIIVDCNVISSPLKEPPDKKQKLHLLNTEEVHNNLKPCPTDERPRATSPDIFADSEDEMEIGVDAGEAPHADVEKCMTFEIYSSDEVKISSTCAEKMMEEQLKPETVKNCCPVVVDLTGDETITTIDASIRSKKFNEVEEDFDIFLSSSPEPSSPTNNPPASLQPLNKITSVSEKNASQKSTPTASILPATESDIPSKLQTSKTDSHFVALDSDDDDNELLLEIKSAKTNSFHDFQGDKQICTSFHFETAMRKNASRYQPDDSNCESFNESLFKLLRQKYLDSNSKSKARSKRKSMSMTQLHVANSSTSLTSRKRLSFTQMEQQIYKGMELDEATTKCNASSPFKHAGANIDLTQNENSCDVLDAAEDDCIILSDDEINYSIWKADKTMQLEADEKSHKYTQDLTKSSDSEAENTDEKSKSPALQQHEFSFQELLGVNKSSIHKQTSKFDFDGDNEPLQSQFMATQTDAYATPIKPADLSKERAEFGILDCYSEPLVQSPFLTPTKQIKTTNHEFPNENSFLCSPSETAAPMKRYSSTSSSQKFNALLQQVQQDEQSLDTTVNALDDYDEFDRLVYGSPKFRKPIPAAAQKSTPIGLQQLLTAELSFREEPGEKQDYTTPKKLYVSPGKKGAKTPTKEELCINGRRYEVRVTTTPKPDFSAQTDAELLKQLYNFGIKPLKRKQALLMLEYIYNQTHPILLNEGETAEDVKRARQQNAVEKEANVAMQQVEPASQKTAPKPSQKSSQTAVRVQQTRAAPTLHENKFNLSDCFGYLLLRHQHYLCAELPAEEYIFQTNVSKKLTQALLPLHIAWFNLVCSSTSLHEAILMFEPIDLQEVYLFFKSIGYRYDPKDLKLFFDRRCIIFRYDLGAPNKPNGGNRHVRKNKKTSSTQQKLH